MRAWVSPPQLRTSCMVQTAPSIAQAASTAFPPLAKIMAPAVAASGFPVIATHSRPWRTGFSVRWPDNPSAVRPTHRTRIARKIAFIGPSFPRDRPMADSPAGRIEVPKDAEGETPSRAGEHRDDALMPGVVVEDEPGDNVADDGADGYVGGPVLV